MRQVGRLVKWDESRGFGFIQPEGGGPQVFVHISKFVDRRRAPVIGAELTFDVARDLQNRMSAAFVRQGGVISPSRRHPRQDSRSAGHPWLAALVAFAALLGLGVAAIQERLPWFIAVLFVVASLAVFLAYAFDKSAAMNQRQRTPENVLHLMNLLGGWPGGLFASQLFHHKSKKLEFRAVFYFCIALNCAAIAWIVYARPF